MLTTYGSLRKKYNSTEFSVITTANGTLSSGGALNIYVQGRNRSGFNLQSDPIVINYNAGDRIEITLNGTLRSSIDNLFRVVISASRTTPENAVILCEWEAKSPDQLSDLSLPVTLFLSEDDHIETDNLICETSDLLPLNPIHGMRRYVTDSGWVRYNEANDLWENYPINANSFIAATTDFKGCDRPINDLGNNVIINPPLYSGDNSQSNPVTLWLNNSLLNAQFTLEAGSSLNFTVAINNEFTNANGDSWALDFYNKLYWKIDGVIDFNNLTVDTSINTSFTPWLGAFENPVNLSPTQALVVSVNMRFNLTELLNLIPDNATIGINLVNTGLRGSEFKSGYFTGSAVLDGDFMRVLPDPNGLVVGSGVVIIEPHQGVPYISPFRLPQSVDLIGVDSADQKVVLNAASGGVASIKAATQALTQNEGLRAVISTLPGTGNASNWQSLTVEANGSIQVNLTYPQTIRSEYPDQIAGLSATFNAPYIKIYVRFNGVVYSVEVLATAFSLTDTFEITTLETQENVISNVANYSLFSPPNFTLTANTNGTLTVGVYEIAIANHYPIGNTDVVAISHDSAIGCIPELQSTLSDILGGIDRWSDPIATIALLKDITPTINELRYVAETNLIYRYKSDATETANDRSVVSLNNAVGRWIAISENAPRSVFSIAELKAVINADDRSLWIVNDLTSDYGIILYIYLASDTATTYENLILVPDNNLGRYHALNINKVVSDSDPTLNSLYPGLEWLNKATGFSWIAQSDLSWQKINKPIVVADMAALIVLTPQENQEYIITSLGSDYPNRVSYYFLSGSTLQVYQPVTIADNGATGVFYTKDIKTIIEAIDPVNAAPFIGLKHFNTANAIVRIWNVNWVNFNTGAIEVGGLTDPTLSYKEIDDQAIPVRFWYKGSGSTYTVELLINNQSITSFSGTNTDWVLYSGSIYSSGENAFKLIFSRSSTAISPNDDFFSIAYLQIGNIFFDKLNLSQYAINDSDRAWSQTETPIWKAPETLEADQSSTLIVIANAQQYSSIYNRNNPSANLVNCSFELYSSTDFNDYFRLFVNNDNAISISGVNSWSNRSFSVNPGIVDLVFEYARVTPIGSNEDTVKIRNLKIGDLNVSFDNVSSSYGFELNNYRYPFTTVWENSTYYLRNANLPTTNSNNLIYVSRLKLTVLAALPLNFDKLTLTEATGIIPVTDSTKATLTYHNDRFWIGENNKLPYHLLGLERLGGLQTVTHTSDTLTCRFRVNSSTSNNSYEVYLYIDGAYQTIITGTNNNNIYSYFLPEGYHTFAFVCRQNVLNSNDLFEINLLDFGDIKYNFNTNLSNASGITLINWSYDSFNKSLKVIDNQPVNTIASLVIRVDVRKPKAALTRVADVMTAKNNFFNGKLQYIADTANFNNLKIYVINSENDGLALSTDTVTSWTENSLTLYPGINILRFEYQKTVAQGTDGDVCKIADLKLGDIVLYEIGNLNDKGWLNPDNWTIELGTMPNGDSGYYLRSPSNQPVGTTTAIELQINTTPYKKTDNVLILDDTQSNIYPNALLSNKFRLNVTQDCWLYTPNNIYEGYRMSILITYGGSFTLSFSGYNLGGYTLPANTTVLLEFLYINGAFYLTSERSF